MNTPPAEDLLDALARSLARVRPPAPWPGSPAAREDLAIELDRLRAVEAAAVHLVAKVDEHERKGYKRIKLGAAEALRAALAGDA